MGICCISDKVLEPLSCMEKKAEGVCEECEGCYFHISPDDESQENTFF